MRDATYATLMSANNVQTRFDMCRQHMDVATSGMKLMGEGSRRLPRSVRNDEMGNLIWICVGLVIVFLTGVLSGLIPSLVTLCGRRRKGAEEEKRRVVACTEREELEVPPCSEILLAELQQESAHQSERRVLKSESNGCSCAAVVPFALCGDGAIREHLLSSESGFDVKDLVKEIIHDPGRGVPLA